MRKGQSKRVTLQQKYKIQKRVKEYKRKLKKAGKKLGPNGGIWKSLKQQAIPNDWPFKDQMLTEMERQKALEVEAEEKNKAARKAAAEKKKRDAAAGIVPKVAESSLPRGMGAPIGPTSAQSNAILLDAYTKRVWREVRQVVEESDVVLEVLDARDPLGSRCLELEQWAHGKLLEKAAKKAAGEEAPAPKPIILVLNKTDLVPVSVTQAWLDFFAEHDSLFPVVAFHSHRALEDNKMKGQVVSPKDLCPGAASIMQLIGTVAAEANASVAEGAAPRPVKVGIIGFGNVGKSSVLNTLARTHAAGVGTVAGYTKELSRFRLAKGIYAIDSPAVPSTDAAPGPHIELPLSNNRIKDDVAQFMRHFDSDNLARVLQVPASDNLEGFLASLAKKAGKMMKGAELNLVLAARNLLKDWNRGKIPFFTAPPDMDDDEEDEDMEKEGEEKSAPSALQSFFVASNRRTLLSLKAQATCPPESAFMVVEGSLFEEVPASDEEGEDDEEEDDEEQEEEEGEDEDMEDEEEEEEEEEEVPPPRPTQKGKGKQQPAPQPQQPAKQQNKKGAAAAAAAAPAAAAKPAAPAAKPAAKAAAKAAAAPVATPAPTPVASRKRAAREVVAEEDEDEEPAAPVAKKQAAASKANANKPAAAKPTPTKAAAAKPTPAAAAASSSTKKGKKGGK